MVFSHIVDDYYLQGKLALFKQKSWWEEKAPDEMYKHDYIVALMMHSFSWAFMIMLPIAVSHCRGAEDKIRVASVPKRLREILTSYSVNLAPLVRC